MKQIFILLTCVASTLSLAQIKAVTEDGYDVTLFKDGTWKYNNATDAEKVETVVTNPTPFTVPASSTFLLRSKRINSGIKYNPKEWSLVNRPGTSPINEYILMSKDGGSYANYLTEVTPNIPLGTLQDVLLNTLRTITSFLRVNKAEYRTVNGQKVLYMQYSANIKGLDFEYVANYLSNENGTSQFIAFTNKALFEKNKEKLNELVNGLVPAQKGEEITDQLGPPMPMPAKPKSN